MFFCMLRLLLVLYEVIIQVSCDGINQQEIDQSKQYNLRQ